MLRRSFANRCAVWVVSPPWAARLARAVYHMLRKQEAFDEERFWNGQAKQAQAPTSQTRPAAASGSRRKARAAAR